MFNFNCQRWQTLKERIDNLNNKVNDIILLLTKSKDIYSASYYISKHQHTQYINDVLKNKFNVSKDRIEINKMMLYENDSSIKISEKELLEKINDQSNNEFKIICKLNKHNKKGERIILLNEQGKIKEESKKRIINNVFRN